jgi:hypothetical protein
MTSSSAQDGRLPAAFVGARARVLRIERGCGRCGAQPVSSVGLERKGRDALLEVRS